MDVAQIGMCPMNTQCESSFLTSERIHGMMKKRNWRIEVVQTTCPTTNIYERLCDRICSPNRGCSFDKFVPHMRNYPSGGIAIWTGGVHWTSVSDGGDVFIVTPVRPGFSWLYAMKKARRWTTKDTTIPVVSVVSGKCLFVPQPQAKENSFETVGTA